MPHLRHPIAALCLVAALVSPVVGGCGAAPMHRYERTGTAGAFLFVGGAVTTWAGRQTWEANHQETGVTMMTTGAALQIAGLLMTIWALDGLILQPGGYDPARGQRPILP